MPVLMIEIRKRFFLAVEGESERSFAKLLFELSNGITHIHLDTYVLNGGGYKTMLNDAVRFRKKGLTKGLYHDSFLIVDSDRAGQDPGEWRVEKLKQEAAERGLTVCLQRPNHEAVLCRMTPGYESYVLTPQASEATLKSIWPTYEKPADARALRQHYELDDLLRMAKHDPDFRNLLQRIGLMNV
jgi:hypothetical protein